MQGSELQRQALDSELTYAAFRAAFVVTLDTMLASCLDESGTRSSHGFLDRMPLMQGVAPHVQLECLLTTWRAIAHEEPLCLLDEVVIQASAETLCHVADGENDRTLRLIWRGPRTLTEQPDQWLTSKVRMLQVMLSETDLPRLLSLPEPGNRKRGNESIAEDAVFAQERSNLMEVVGRWRVTKNLLEWNDGLMTENEQGLIRAFFEEHPSLFG
ncbi:MAG: hypothetical protein KDA96_06985 [Planctomycetaceae bacterium]|nr:hypothetical protein [Planctomycetaceae bacterium]